MENATRSKVQEAIKQGYVWVNGKHEKASYKMLPGGRYIELPIAPPPEAVAEVLPLDIVYEDADLLVVNKAAGSGAPCLWQLDGYFG